MKNENRANSVVSPADLSDRSLGRESQVKTISCDFVEGRQSVARGRANFPKRIDRIKLQVVVSLFKYRYQRRHCRRSNTLQNCESTVQLFCPLQNLFLYCFTSRFSICTERVQT